MQHVWITLNNAPKSVSSLGWLSYDGTDIRKPLTAESAL